MSLHDPREQVVLRPDDTPASDEASVIRSQAATIADLQRTLHDLAKTPPPLQVVDAQAALERIAACIGWKRLAVIVKNLAFIEGETV